MMVVHRQTLLQAGVLLTHRNEDNALFVWE